MRILAFLLALVAFSCAHAAINFNPEDIDCVIDYNWWGSLAPKLETLQVLNEQEDGNYQEILVSIICTATDDLKLKDADGQEFEVGFMDEIEYTATFYRTLGAGQESCGGWEESDEYVAAPYYGPEE